METGEETRILPLPPSLSVSSFRWLAADIATHGGRRQKDKLSVSARKIHCQPALGRVYTVVGG